MEQRTCSRNLEIRFADSSTYSVYLNGTEIIQGASYTPGGTIALKIRARRPLIMACNLRSPELRSPAISSRLIRVPIRIFSRPSVCFPLH